MPARRVSFFVLYREIIGTRIRYQTCPMSPQQPSLLHFPTSCRPLSSPSSPPAPSLPPTLPIHARQRGPSYAKLHLALQPSTDDNTAGRGARGAGAAAADRQPVGPRSSQQRRARHSAPPKSSQRHQRSTGAMATLRLRPNKPPPASRRPLPTHARHNQHTQARGCRRSGLRRRLNRRRLTSLGCTPRRGRPAPSSGSLQMPCRTRCPLRSGPPHP